MHEYLDIVYTSYRCTLPCYNARVDARCRCYQCTVYLCTLSELPAMSGHVTLLRGVLNGATKEEEDSLCLSFDVRQSPPSLGVCWCVHCSTALLSCLCSNSLTRSLALARSPLTGRHVRAHPPARDPIEDTAPYPSC